MLPASNRGVGMALNFPDVCLTPSPVGPIPIPYPNLAMNAQAVPFALLVMISGVNALNMGARVPLTNGDQGGVAHPSMMGPGAFTLGNPLVFIEGLPAINLLCPTSGNNMNAPLGAVIVPSVVNVLFCRRTVDVDDGDDVNHVNTVGLGALRSLGKSPEVRARLLGPTLGYLGVDVLATDVGARFYSAVADLRAQGARGFIVDLRGCPGGDLDATLRLADEFLPAGAVIARVTDDAGDEIERRAQGAPAYEFPVVVLVDRDTASAAEVLAGALQTHGVARLVGERTWGKGTALEVVARAEGGAVLAAAARVTLADGAVIESTGLTPDVRVEGGADEVLRVACGLFQ